MKKLIAWCIFSTALFTSASAVGEEAKIIHFDEQKNESIYVSVINNQGNKVLNLAGVHLKPQSDTYIELLEEGENGYLTGILSPDGSRILVSLGHVDEKNVWAVNLITKTIEFESHENVGRHLFPKWLDASRFELMYGGMGYRVEREYKLDGSTWKVIRDKSFDE